MLYKRHFGWILAKNPEVMQRRMNVHFRPYSTEEFRWLLGTCEVKLTNARHKTIKTQAYMIEGEAKSLLERGMQSSWGSSR